MGSQEAPTNTEWVYKRHTRTRTWGPLGKVGCSRVPLGGWGWGGFPWVSLGVLLGGRQWGSITVEMAHSKL